MNKDILKGKMNRTRLRNRFLRTRNIEDKNFIVNSGTIVYLLYGKLSNRTTTILMIGSLPKTNHFGNISNLFFLIEALALA